MLRNGHTPGHARSARAGVGRPQARVWLSAAMALLALPALAELPAGWAKPFDTLVEQQGDGETWLILRYLAPQIARDTGSLGYEDVIPAMDALCAADGVEAAQGLIADGQPIDQIVISVMDRPIERGVPAPDATRFISAYTLGPEGCIWQ